MSSNQERWRPGDRAVIKFPDGVRRPAELSRGFVWVSTDGEHKIFAEGGFDAAPLLSVVPDEWHAAYPSDGDGVGFRHSGSLADCTEPECRVFAPGSGDTP